MLRLNSDEPVELVLKSDTDTEAPATFYLKPIPEKKYPSILPLLDRFQKMLLPEDSTEDESEMIAGKSPEDLLQNATEEDIEALDELASKVMKMTIVGWKNILDDKGEELVFDYKLLDEAVVKFPFPAKIEIAFNAISLTTTGGFAGE